MAPRSDADARELAVALGISYRPVGKSDYSHSNVISLLDENGVVVAKIDSLSASTEVFVEAVKKSRSLAPHPTGHE